MTALRTDDQLAFGTTDDAAERTQQTRGADWLLQDSQHQILRIRSVPPVHYAVVRRSPARVRHHHPETSTTAIEPAALLHFERAQLSLLDAGRLDVANQRFCERAN